MENKIKGLLLGAVCMFAMAGCSSAAEAPQEPEEISAEVLAEEALAALENADGFTADFQVTVSMGEAGKTSTEGSVMMQKDPLYMKVDTVLAFEEQEQPYVLYLEKTEDAVNQYMNYGGEWTEMTLTEESALSGVQIYNTPYNMEAVISAVESWSAEPEDGLVKLTGVIPGSRFYDVEEYARWFQMAGMSGLSAVYFEGVEDVPVTMMLEERTGEPVSYSVELADALEIVTNNVLKEMNGGTLENGIVVEEYRITSELTQLGGVEAEEIPAEAKKDAINYEKEISLLENAE